jgi:ABC-type transport system involved in multi-copper enzyme maturation permease subunit
MFPFLSDSFEDMEALMDFFPAEIMEVFGATDLTDMATFEGFISIEYLSFIWVMLFAAMIIALGRKLVAKEVEDKTADVLFALPAHRVSVFSAKFVAFFGIILVVAAAALVVLFIGGVIIGEGPNGAGFFLFYLITAALSFFLLAATGVFSSLFSTAGKVAASAGGLLVASYVLHVMSVLNETVERFYFLSFFKYYDNPREVLMREVFHLEYLSVFLIVGALLFAVSLVVTSRRDM